MLKNTLLFFLFSITQLAFSQSEVQFFDADWERVESTKNAIFYRVITLDEGKNPIGIVRDYYMSGKLQWEGKLVLSDEELVSDSICTWYHENGNKAQEVFYIQGNMEGQLLEYYDNGDLYQQSFYTNGQCEGKVLEYYSKDVLKKESYFKNGLPDSISLEYYDNGDLHEKAFYRDGNLNDTRITYSQDPYFVIDSATYVNGQLDGKSIQRYPNGKIQKMEINILGEIQERIAYSRKGEVTGHYYKPPENGEYVTYYPNGQIESKSYYKNSLLEGDYLFYNTSGKLWIKVPYQKGKLNGWKHNYAYNPELSLMELYQDDSLKKEVFTFIKSGSVAHVVYYKDDGLKYDSIFWDYTGALAEIRISKTVYPEDSAYSEDLNIMDGNGKEFIIFQRQWNNKGKLTHHFPPLPDDIKIARSPNDCLFGLKKVKGDWVLEPKYSTIGQFVNNMAIVSLDSLYGVIDTNGKELFPLQKAELSIPYETTLFPGFFFLTENEKKGLLIIGKGIVFPPKYSFINISKWQHNAVTIGQYHKNDPSVYGITDTTGKIILPLEYTDLSALDDNNWLVNHEFLYWVGAKNGKYGITRNDGKIIIPYENKDMCPSSIEGIIWATAKEGKVALFDLKGNKIKEIDGEPYYVETESGGTRTYDDCNSEVKIYTHHQKIQFYDKKGNLLVEADSFSIVDEHVYIIYKNNKCSLINENGEFILKDFDEIIPEESYYSYTVRQGNLYGYYNKEGKQVLPIIYEKITSYNIHEDDDYNKRHDRTFTLKKNGKYGAMHENGKILVPFIYDYQENLCFYNKDTMICYDGSFKNTHHLKNVFGGFLITPFAGGLINNKGRFVLFPEYEIKELSQDRFLCTDKNKNTFLFLNDGKKIPIPGKFSTIKYVDSYLVLQQENGECILFDSEGQQFSAKNEGEIIGIREGYIYASPKNYPDLLTVSNFKGDQIIDTSYIFISAFDNDSKTFWAKPNNSVSADFYEVDWVLLSSEGKKLLPFHVDYPSKFSSTGLALVSLSDSSAIINSKGECVLPFSKNKIFIEDWLFWIKKEDGQYYLFNNATQKISEKGWEKYIYLGDNISMVYQQQFPLLINHNNEIIYKPENTSYVKASQELWLYLAQHHKNLLRNADLLEFKDEIRNQNQLKDLDDVNTEKVLNLIYTTSRFDNDMEYAVFFNWDGEGEIYAAKEIPEEYHYGDEGLADEKKVEIFLSKFLHIQQKKSSSLLFSFYVNKKKGNDYHYSENTYDFYSFMIESAQSKRLLIEDLLILDKKNKLLLGELIYSKKLLVQSEEEKLICEDKNQAPDFSDFTISSEGLVFYFFHQQTQWSEPELRYLTIPFKDLKPMFKDKKLYKKLTKKIAYHS